ncbi:MAG: PmoA family protein [Planctomycetaceae bacterium]|nr:PmoA family protein [Planctomycetaceae bacterium]
MTTSRNQGHRSPVIILQCAIAIVLAGFATTPLFAQSEQTSASAKASDSGLAFERTDSGLRISHSGQSIANYHRQDSRIFRPFFSSVQTPNGIQVTRNHPPVEGKDAMDHDTMHPGIWLAFGDVSGQDFWRNKAKMTFEKELQSPAIKDGSLIFADSFRMLDSNDQLIGRQESHFELRKTNGAWRLRWTATFIPQSELVFGDQEEMGLGVRVATSMTEKNGGRIISSTGATGAGSTWGKSAEWCSYSGAVDGKPAGIIVIPSPKNFHPSWWHNRDYGLMVANPFAQAALAGGSSGKLMVKHDAPLVLSFDVVIHDGEFRESLVKAP